MADEWTTVKKVKRTAAKGGSKRQNTSNTLLKRAVLSNHIGADEDDGSNAQDVAIKCQNLSESLQKSVFFKLLIKEITDTPQQQCLSIISLGIGQFTQSPSALLQLAMVLSIRKELTTAYNTESGDDSSVAADIVSNSSTQIQIECKMFDPLFSAKERDVCNFVGLAVSEENRKGKHKAEKRPTIFFMPHCPYRLYVNLLWENWDHLEDVVILGNSFLSYGIRRSVDDDKTDCMRIIGPLITEKPVWDLFSKNHPKGRRYEQSLPADSNYLENAFCDLSIHTFDKKVLASPLGQRILALKPSEADIDQAALLDVELFS